jgi:CHAT domain-containing protein
MISTAEISLLGIAAENAHNSTMPRLRHVVSEVAETTGMVKNTGATIKSNADGSLAHSDVLAWFQSANIVHLACHGIQNPKDPHKSRFCLSTGDITVSELMSMELKNASIAFLSACETAKGDAEHADEVVHLAATMLFAGFKSIVATMW